MLTKVTKNTVQLHEQKPWSPEGRLIHGRGCPTLRPAVLLQCPGQPEHPCLSVPAANDQVTRIRVLFTTRSYSKLARHLLDIIYKMGLESNFSIILGKLLPYRLHMCWIVSHSFPYLMCNHLLLLLPLPILPLPLSIIFRKSEVTPLCS